MQHADMHYYVNAYYDMGSRFDAGSRYHTRRYHDAQ